MSPSLRSSLRTLEEDSSTKRAGLEVVLYAQLLAPLLYGLWLLFYHSRMTILIKRPFMTGYARVPYFGDLTQVNQSIDSPLLITDIAIKYF